MRNAILFLLVVVTPGLARASGGFQIDEQSATAAGMAGAQTAVATDASCMFYNPAGMTFRAGYSGTASLNIVSADTTVRPDGVHARHVAAAPSLYGTQRLGKYVAVGLGGFVNFAEHFDYPPGFRGRFQGYFIDITTLTLNAAVAIRPTPWLSFAAGFDLIPASLELFRAIDFGAGEGNVHVGASAVGLGANAGVMVDIIRQRLRFGAAYRSRADLDFTGHGSISAPEQLQAIAGGRQNAKVTLPLPHNFAIGLAGFVGRLTVTAEVKVSMWSDLKTLTLTLTDPAQPGSMPTTDSLALDFHNTWALRGGAEYRFLRNENLRARLGVGYDTTPVPTKSLGPLVPDTNRALASVGIGYAYKWFSVDAGYLLVFLLKTESTNPDYLASFQTTAHLFSISASMHLDNFGPVKLASSSRFYNER
jgi:long-chain fatty acid transport protein